MAAMTAAVGCCVLLGKAQADDGLSVEVVDAVEISADTNVVVEAGRTLKFEYVYGESSVTVTKSGAGRLEIATSSHTNLSVNVVEGTFASARPAAIPMTGEFKPVLRVDASVTNTFTFAKANGTNFISKIVDADGNNERWLTSWGGEYKKPYLADEKLNGMSLIDFGTYYDRDVACFAGGWGGNLALNKFNDVSGFVLKEFFYVWKDRDDIFDAPLVEGAEFRGPSVLGNDGDYFLRGMGGAGKGFEIMSDGMWGTYKNSFIIDSKKVARTFRPSKGFHLLRNRANETSRPARNLTTIGVNAYNRGGFILAEIVAYSNQLSEATALRIEAQLQAKWLGTKLNTVTVRNAATLDVGAFKFNVKTLDITGSANVAGATNLCFDTLAKASGDLAMRGVFEIDGRIQPLVPDMSFDGDARISVAGESRVQTVSATTGRLEKLGDGELRMVDPNVSNVTVTAGTLNVSPLEVRSAEYHLDATRFDTLELTMSDDGKKLVSAWRDIEDSSRAYVKCESWLPVRFDESHILRRPYITENAAGNMPMVDFGTYFSAHHRDGWGGCLNGSPRPGGLVDIFVAWKDYPEVKNIELSDSANVITGPCFLGMEYHWARGRGGDGAGFPIHYPEAPSSMYKPLNTGLVMVDGVDANGVTDRIGDGVHVLAQRISADSPQGFSIQTLGGCDQARVFLKDTDDMQRGVFGGLMIGEVLMFKRHLSDRLRMRISGALCSKWRGGTNEWAYGSLKVASGATLKHPHADLVPETLELAGTLSSVSVKPGILKVEGDSAEIVGELRLAEGGTVNVVGDPENGFASVKASSVRAGGKGSIAIGFASAGAHVGEEFRIVESDDVQADADFQWRVTALQGTGVRGKLKAKSDGIYLSFEGSGMTVTVR